MINRHLSSSLLVSVALALVTAPSLSHGQAAAPPSAPAMPPSAPSAPAANPPAAPDTTTPAERPATYTLQQGDTLEKIAKQYGLTGRQLQKYNKFTNAQVRRLQIGQVVKIPPASASK
jgi:LysM repeat protein